MREETFTKLSKEYSLEFALRVVEFLVVVKTMKIKRGDVDEGNFLKRCKKKFSNKIAYTTDDIDLISNVAFACCDYETHEDLCGLGGCEIPKTISELVEK